MVSIFHFFSWTIKKKKIKQFEKLEILEVSENLPLGCYGKNYEINILFMGHTLAVSQVKPWAIIFFRLDISGMQFPVFQPCDDISYFLKLFWYKQDPPLHMTVVIKFERDVAWRQECVTGRSKKN